LRQSPDNNDFVFFEVRSVRSRLLAGCRTFFLPGFKKIFVDYSPFIQYFVEYKSLNLNPLGGIIGIKVTCPSITQF